MDKNKALTNYNISNPSQLSAMASILKTHIVKNQLFTKIAGKNYVHVEGWQFAGGLIGTMPRIVKIDDLSKTGDVKWLAQAEIVELKTGKVVGTGFAVCSNKENKKKSFDEYAVLSMAQTRAIGKAYRNTIGWVIKLAGYEGTPAEEISEKQGKDTPEPMNVSEKITKDESDKLLGMALQKGFSSKAKLIVAVNRLLKTQIGDLMELNKSQANSVMISLLKK